MKKILEVSCNGLTNGGVQQVIMSIVRNLYKEYHFDKEDIELLKKYAEKNR